MKKKLLVLGVSGLTGYKIANLAQSQYEVYGTYNSRKAELSNTQIFKLDISDKTNLSKLFSEIKPDVIINTTALHNVDYCEEHPSEAYSVNKKAVELLHTLSEKNSSRLIHISTDYVFDGQKTEPYTEEDLPNPISEYGNSKLEGEQILGNSSHVVLRPSVVYGWTPLELAGTISSSGKPMNFAMWLLTKLNKNEDLKIVVDQFASATLADSLADSALKIAKTTKSGLYHVSGLSCESRYDFAIALAKKFGYSDSKISKVSSSEFKQKAKRPQFSCLNSSKAIEEFELKLLSTDEALEIMKNQVLLEAPNLIGKN